MNKILPIEIKRSKHKITPYGGLLLIYEGILGLGLDRVIDRELPRPGSNRGFRPSEYVVPLMLMQHGGGRELEDITKLRSDETLGDMIKTGTKGRKKLVIPTSDATGNWLRRMGGKKSENGRAEGLGLAGLGKVNKKLCNLVLKEMEIEQITLDADATVISCNKEEADWTYKKVRGFQPMLGYISELGLCLHEEFRAGNIPARAGALEFIEACQKQLTGRRRIKAIRSDSAWYQAEVFNWCEDNGVSFAIAAGRDESVMSAIFRIAEEEWKPFRNKEGIQTERQIAETVHSMEGTGNAFRLVVQRWIVYKSNQLTLSGSEDIRYAYHIIATNREESAEEVVYWYNQRGNCENWIKEEKLGFGTEYLPCSRLGANAMFFRIGLLAYNLSVIMKLLVFPKEYRHRQIRTIRWRVYQWAGYLTRHAGKVVLRLSAPEEVVGFFKRCRHRCWLLSSA